MFFRHGGGGGCRGGGKEMTSVHNTLSCNVLKNMR